MNTWYDYRAVWSAHPWVLVYAVFVVLLVIVSIAATATGGGPLAVLFIPSLAGVYIHHLIVMKKVDG